MQILIQGVQLVNQGRRRKAPEQKLWCSLRLAQGVEAEADYLTKCGELLPAIHVKGTVSCLLVWKSGTVLSFFEEEINENAKRNVCSYLQTLSALIYAAKGYQTWETFWFHNQPTLLQNLHL